MKTLLFGNGGVSLNQVYPYQGMDIARAPGIVLGILAVMDRVPRSLTLQQKEVLVAWSTQAISLTACCANMQSELRNNLTNLKRRVNKRQQQKEARQAYIKNSQISS